MAAGRTRVSRGEHNAAGQLAFDVDVILMDSAGLEIRGLVNKRSWVGGHSLGSRKQRKAGRGGEVQLRRLSEGGGAVRSGEGAACGKSGGELVGLAKVGRILPQALRALVPG